MLDKIEDLDGENIRRKKDKKISKHYDILINDNIIKIVNFLIKDNKHLDRQGKIIRLISSTVVGDYLSNLTPTQPAVVPTADSPLLST